MALTYEVREVRDRDSSSSGVAEWRRFLEEAGVDTGIYCEPLFVEEAVSTRNGCSLVLVVGTDESGTQCILPFRLQRERTSVQLGLWKVGLPGASVLCLPDFEFAVRSGSDRFLLLREAVRALRGTVRADLVRIDNAPGLKPAEVGGSMADWSFRQRQTTYVIREPTDYARYWSSLSSRVRIELKRRTKRLEERCHGSVLLRKYTRPEQMAEAHAQITKVWRKSWHAAVGGAVPLQLTFMERLATQGWVRSYVLLAEGQPIAYLWGYQYRDKYYYDSIAFDADWGAHAPGKVLNNLMLADLLGADSPRLLDFGSGYNRYKEELGTHAEERAQVWVPFTWNGRAIAAALGLAERLGTLGRETARRQGLYQWLRRRSRQAAPGRAEWRSPES
jgi:CelD/BcsL family acetyltransferase involved in cellulose biosynthesis